MRWTDDQRKAIETTGVSLLVSAAAGSGKTAVLAERCAYLVCDAPEKSEIDELLVVTFTKAAASEMRSRIELALRKRQTSADDPRLSRQLMLIDRASIGTLHSFCANLLRRHFHAIGIDPGFRLLDEEESLLLRREVARDMLDQHYETDDSGEFQRFVDLYGNGDDQILLKQIIQLDALLGSVVNPARWLAEAQSRIAEASQARPLIKSAMGRELSKRLAEWLDDLRLRWMQLARQIEPISGLDDYLDYVGELLATVDVWKDAFMSRGIDGLHEQFTQFKMPTLPTIRNPPPEKEAMQNAMNAIRSDMKPGNSVADYCRFSEDEWRDGLSRIESPTHVIIELARDYSKRYSAAKQEHRSLDFSDLERLTLRVLSSNDPPDPDHPSPAALEYRRQFKHVLVDEYQDINDVQNAILQLLSREARPAELSPPNGSPNLFCVGDVKQSIYRFRLAQPKRFLQRHQRLHSGAELGQVIDLSTNFRSRGPLLEAINGVFRRLMTQAAVEIEYDESHALRPGAKYPDESDQPSFRGSPIELHVLPAPTRQSQPHQDESNDDLDRTEREAAFVAQRIKQLMSSSRVSEMSSDDGALILRPIRYRDIVILLRSMAHKAEDYARVLRASGIPVHSEARGGFFDSTEIRDMLALLRVLDNQQQDIPLTAILRSPMVDLTDREDALARIRLTYPDLKTIAFHQAVVRYAAGQSNQLAEQLRVILNELAVWRRLAHEKPLAEVIWHILSKTGYLAFCAGMPEGQQRVANLIHFHERARQFGSFQRQGLARFMNYISTLEDESDIGLPNIASDADDVVRIMSIHRSKGLEFPVVFVPDLGKQHNFSDARKSILIDRDAGIGMLVADETLRVKYPSLAHVLAQEQITRQTLAEEMRVLYVAMTRAREHLVLVGVAEEGRVADWRDHWSNHTGPLPAGRVLAARSMLDWLGPAWAAISGASEQHGIDLTIHAESEVAGWSVASQRRPKLPDEKLPLARLEPLDPAPEIGNSANEIIARLEAMYSFDVFTKLPAADSVGAIAKRDWLPTASPPGHRKPMSALARDLRQPSRLAADLSLQKSSAADLGSATHRVLEHLTFSRPCDETDLKNQIDRLVELRLLPPELAATVEIDSILWMLSTDLGRLLRSKSAMVRREVPIHFPHASPHAAISADPLDCVMVRGRVDMLVIEQDGLTVVDFKTDRVTSSTIDTRATGYENQIRAYANALRSITNLPIKSAMLVFLYARSIRTIALQPS
jgi:ATP-dependent helicase/nuclease subunit A